MKISTKAANGRKRPTNGPYPKGVVNGPDPSTARGWRRRVKNTQDIGEKDIAGVEVES